jgi:DNA-binding transcriptional LysR family regulator
METNYLSSFMAVLESGSMSEAARRLNLTAAAVAQQMRVLERELGVPLLRRAGRTVSPTEAGHRLADRAPSLLAELTGLRSAVGDDTGVLELTIGATNTMLNGLLPVVLEALVREHPAARIVVRPGLTSELYDQDLPAPALCAAEDAALGAAARRAAGGDRTPAVVGSRPARAAAQRAADPL